MKNPLIVGLLFSACFAYGAQESAPDWVREVTSRALPNYPPEAHTATLLDETRTTINPDGSTLQEIREAVRVLTPEGRGEARAFVPYYQKVTKIRELKAWLIAPDGSTKTYGKGDVVDRGLQEEYELYADQRAKEITPANVTPGSTFVWSAQVEDHPVSAQQAWSFQHRDPVLLSRLVMTVPSGWEAKAVTFNHDPIQPIIDGNTYTWELKDLYYIKREKQSPGPDSVAPWIGITYYAKDDPKALREWKDISIKQTALDEAQTSTNDELNAEVHRLAASGANTLDQIRAISRFVQGLKYVAIETNLAHGGGSLPHPAVQVFAKRYGDCKDKANLMRTMLRQIGVESYMVVVYAGDRNHVHPEWAGDQFNHMILAIKVNDNVSLPAVVTHPVLGRLLIFDSTDSFTPLGILPDYEQGSYGLLLAGDKGGILQLPVAPPAANRTDISVESTLSADGILQAKLEMKSRAEDATTLRELMEERHEEFEKDLTAWLQHNVRQLDGNKMEAKDSFENGEMDLHFDFKAPRYAQVMQGRMLVFKPSIVEPYYGFPLQSDKRVNPLVLDSESYHKEVHVKLPEGFKVDEMPEPAAFSSSFGKYSSECKLNGTDLLFTEDLTIGAVTLPADQYKEARDFFGKVVGAERNPLVLVKN